MDGICQFINLIRSIDFKGVTYMLAQNSYERILYDIVKKVIAGSISMDEIREKIQNDLEAYDIWESQSLLITDCYYALKHVQEENISLKEWKYFEECLNNSREYNLEEKKQFILNE